MTHPDNADTGLRTRDVGVEPMTIRQDMTVDEAIGYALLETEHIGGFARRGPSFRERLAEAGYAVSRLLDPDTSPAPRETPVSDDTEGAG